MKKSVTLILVLMALAGVAVLIFRNCIDTIVTRQNSEVYRRYCKKDGLQVSWVKDYPVGDSLFFDLTVTSLSVRFSEERRTVNWAGVLGLTLTTCSR